MTSHNDVNEEHERGLICFSQTVHFPRHGVGELERGLIFLFSNSTFSETGSVPLDRNKRECHLAHSQVMKLQMLPYYEWGGKVGKAFPHAFQETSSSSKDIIANATKQQHYNT